MMAAARPGQRVLGLATGTVDFTRQLSKKVGPEREVWLTDINPAMLQRGRDRMLDLGLNQVKVVQVDAQSLLFADNHFDVVTIAFGLRNVIDQQQTLAAITHVLKPGGRCIVLEFSKPVLPGLGNLYDWYSFNVLPRLAEWVAKDSDSYRYFAESIRMHPDQSTLTGMMADAGLGQCSHHNLLGGIFAIYRGMKS